MASDYSMHHARSVSNGGLFPAYTNVTRYARRFGSGEAFVTGQGAG